MFYGSNQNLLLNSIHFFNQFNKPFTNFVKIIVPHSANTFNNIYFKLLNIRLYVIIMHTTYQGE